VEEDLHLDHHISHKYNEELEHLKGRVLKMGGLAEDQCRNALLALSNGDLALAESVAGADHRINELEVAINAECTEILARRQPAASDLRLLLAIIRISSDLERIGDEAEKIGRLAAKLAGDHEKRNLCMEPLHLGEAVIDMLKGALDAFARLDVETAIETAGKDSQIDREFEMLTRALITRMMEQPRGVKSMLRVNWCARALERVGDHSVNICEQVVFLVKGSDVRHLSLEEIREKYLG
jgi:phosphate transport system protein